MRRVQLDELVEYLRCASAHSSFRLVDQETEECAAKVDAEIEPLAGAEAALCAHHLDAFLEEGHTKYDPQHQEKLLSSGSPREGIVKQVSEQVGQHAIKQSVHNNVHPGWGEKPLEDPMRQGQKTHRPGHGKEDTENPEDD